MAWSFFKSIFKHIFYIVYKDIGFLSDFQKKIKKIKNKKMKLK